MAIAAIGQICSTSDIKHNLNQCVKLVEKAAFNKAKILFLPEASDYIATDGQASQELAEHQSKSTFVLGLQEAAREHKVAIHVGIHHKPQPGARLLNRSLYIDATGSIVDSATYNKVHVLDVAGMKESETVEPGDSLTAPFDTPVGRVGGLICFDLRFPEIARRLAQPDGDCPWKDKPAQIVAYPSAFMIDTGKAHWEILVRARAIETQSWVFAAGQVGKHNGKRATYGKSLVVDPWGRVVVQLKGVTDEEGNPEDGAVGDFGIVDVDLEQVDRIRKDMPLQRRV